MRRMLIKTLFYATVLWGGLFVSDFSNAQLKDFATAQKLQQDILAGRNLYMRRCMGCHGINIDGQGEAAPMLNPKPRNLREGSFRLRSTPSGIPPTREDILRVLNQGVLGTSMPNFGLLSHNEKQALVSYIYSLRPDWREVNPESQVMWVPPPPTEIFSSKEGLLSAAAKGLPLYQENCMVCHGAAGHGDGEGAADLYDEEAQLVRPANLRKRFIKSGYGADDLFRSISTGLDGSPMPGFGDIMSIEERWNLVAYIFQLRGEEAGYYSQTVEAENK